MKQYFCLPQRPCDYFRSYKAPKETNKPHSHDTDSTWLHLAWTNVYPPFSFASVPLSPLAYYNTVLSSFLQRNKTYNFSWKPFCNFMSCATINSKGNPETHVNPEATALTHCIKPHYADTSWESIKILKLLSVWEEVACFHTPHCMCVFNSVNICNSAILIYLVFTLNYYYYFF